MKPIDFIDNIQIEETIFITLENVSTNPIDYEINNYYNRDNDDKWIKFCKKHNLNKREQYSERWYNLYLECCSLGII